MQTRSIANTNIYVPTITLGTWAFGGDKWWGKQNDNDSRDVLSEAISRGLSTIDTAPVYGRGRSERVIGEYIKSRRLREDVIIATKLGLSWQGPEIIHDLSKKRMLEELDQSRQRLQTDYFDIYQVHFPDPDTPIAQTADSMHDFYQRGIIKAVGVSNFSVLQMQEFMKHCPIHSLQPQYSMFVRGIEAEIVPFCLKHDIAIIAYAPLYSGIFTGKFFFSDKKIPDDINRKMKKKDLEGANFEINKKVLQQLKDIADNYKRSLSQLVINWTFSQPGITSAIVGMRTSKQLLDNIGSMGWDISGADFDKIKKILEEREIKIKELS